tara:strand:- start:361 stop:1545 length:1185 start_codon:yes stop_codon:yes gene_type:complete
MFFSKKIDHFLSTRNGIIETIKTKINPSDRVFWFHCASLGEFEQALPLIVSCKKEYPNHKIAITFFSASGFEVQKNYPLADVVTYLPLDRKKSVKKFIEVLRPELLFLIKYEFWPNLIKVLKIQNIPVLSISSIFRQNQLFFKPYGFFMRDLLQKIEFFFVQNEESKKLLASININNTIIIGDTRVDRVLDILSQNNKQKLLEEFIQDQDCFVAGSSWPEDLNLISKVIESSEKLKTIIAPHNVDEKSLQEIESHFSKPIIRWSELSKKTDAESTILLIDCVGILTKVYSYANVAYVGGGMGNKGLHNTLEPAVFGIPVMIGKNYKNYQEAMDLVALGGIISVDSSFNFYKEFSRVMKDKKLQKQMGITNLKYIKSKAGTTFKIMNKLKQVLNS